MLLVAFKFCVAKIILHCSGSQNASSDFNAMICCIACKPVALLSFSFTIYYTYAFLV